MNIAKLHKRLAAAIIDVLIVIFLSFLVIYFFNSNYPYVEYDDAVRQSQYKTRGFLIGLLIDFGYTTYLMQSQMQATFGMRAMSLRIIKVNGDKVELGALSLRYFVSIFSSILLKLGYLYALMSSKSQTVHDYLAGTIVIDEDAEMNEIFKSSTVTSKPIITENTQANNPTNYTALKPIKNEEELWEIAIEEYDSSARKKGLYAKIYAQRNGDESTIKADYIKERYEQLKADEIEKNKIKNKAEVEYNKNQSAEDAIKSGRYTSKKVKEIDCLLFENGQAAIKINESKYRLYEDDASLEKSIKYFIGNGMYLTTGLIRIIEVGNGYQILSCPRCKQKTRVPANKELQITCPSCNFEWVEKT